MKFDLFDYDSNNVFLTWKGYNDLHTDGMKLGVLKMAAKIVPTLILNYKLE